MAEFLEELLTYDCPISGTKRVAGKYDNEIDMGPNKFHGCILKLSLELWTLSSSFTLVDSNLKERKVSTDFRRT